MHQIWRLSASAIAFLVVFQFSGETFCLAVDSEKQIRIGEQLVESQRSINAIAGKTVMLLELIRDKPSFIHTFPKYSSKLKELAKSASDFQQALKGAQPYIVASAPKDKELLNRWNELGQEMSSLTEKWGTFSETLTREFERVEKIRGLSAQHWNQLRGDWAQLEVATLKINQWTGSPAPAATLKYVETKLKLLQRHGPEQVVDVVFIGTSPRGVTTQTDAFRSTLGREITIATRLGVTRNRSVITIAPVTNFKRVSTAITLGKITDQDTARNIVVVSIGATPTSIAAIDTVISKLTDGGKFFSPQGPSLKYLRSIIEQEGSDSLLTVELRNPTSESIVWPQLCSYIWRNEKTGKKVAGSPRDEQVYRCLIRFDGGVSSFAKQIEFGKVESIDTIKKRVVIVIDPEKCTPKALLASKGLRDDPDSSYERNRLQDQIHSETLKLLENPDGSDRSRLGMGASFKAKMSRFKAQRKSEEELDDLQAKNNRDDIRENLELMEKAKLAIQQGKDPREHMKLLKESSQNREREETRLELSIAVKHFDPGRRKKIPTAEQFKHLAEMLSNSRFHQDDAIEILLQLRPEDVADKEITRQIAAGFKELASEGFIEESSAIRGIVVWGGKESVSDLIKLLNESRLSPPIELYAAFVQMKDPRGAHAVAKLLGDFHRHKMAVECLGLMGSVAENALIKVAPSNNADTSLAAVTLLGELGTEKSLSLLKQASKSRNSDIRNAAKKAIELIRERKTPQEASDTDRE